MKWNRMKIAMLNCSGYAIATLIFTTTQQAYAIPAVIEVAAEDAILLAQRSATAQIVNGFVTFRVPTEKN